MYATVFGIFEIHTGFVGMTKGAQNCVFFFQFRAVLGPNSGFPNIPALYWLLVELICPILRNIQDLQGLEKGTEWSIFSISASFWAVLGPHYGHNISNAFKYFPEALSRYWNVFLLFFTIWKSV